MEPSRHSPDALSPFSLSVANEEGRTFRRYPLVQEAGVKIAADYIPHRQAEVTRDNGHSFSGLCYRSILVRDLSLTGLYFVTTLPYRVGCRVEVQLSFALQTLHLPALVRRLVPPAALKSGSPGNEFGCGVDFLYSQMSPVSKQGLIEFLTHHFSPASVVPSTKRASLDAWTSQRPL